MTDTIPQQWSDIRLDSRLVEALRDLRWKAPTTVQAACIPHALRGSDVSLQSRTGSGKTGAFVIPMVQRLLQQRDGPTKSVSKPVGLILVPSVELCEQTVEATNGVCKYVKPRAMVENLATGAVNSAKIVAADIIVSTAAVLAKAIRGGAVNELTFANLQMVVIDEADMMVSIAEKSLRSVQSVLPSTVQAIVCSATLTEGVAAVKGQLLENPVNITLTGDDSGPAPSNHKRAREDETTDTVTHQIVLREQAAKTLQQYYLVATDECHSYTLLFSLFRFKLIEGKTIVFVDEEEHTYKLEHFLQQLGVSSVVYDATLPMNVRLDVLRRFQKGEVLTLICTDNTLESAERLQLTLEDGEDGEQPPLKRGRKESATPNSALHRGVDFNKVRNVIILDGMNTPSAINMSKYTHRVGRTGRAGQPGTSIVVLTVPQTKKVLNDLKDHVKEKGDVIRPFKQLDRKEAAKLQYRVDSTLANVTRSATRKLRVATVAAELARSNYLSTHLSQKDGEVLQRLVRRSTKGIRCDKAVLDVPKYMEIKGNKVDNAKDYAARVNAGKRKEQQFAQVTRKQTVDPLRAVVAKVRNSAKTKSK